MRNGLICVFAATIMLSVSAAAQQSHVAPAAKQAHTIDGHPDLSGIWAYSIDLPLGAQGAVMGRRSVKQTDLSGQKAARRAT